MRSGDFTQSPFHNAHTPDELAFAIGALSHYIGDTIGNSQATSPAVADEFPKLRAKFGWFVDYAQAKNPHVQVEFAFDIKETSKKRLPPAAYFRHIGLLVPGHQLASAFYDTYGLAIGEVVELYPPAVRTYRFGVRTFIPAFAYAEALLHSGGFPPHSPSPELELYKQRLAEVHLEAEWGPFRKDPGIGTYLVAGLIVILPKIGPLAILSIRGPTVDTERRYLASMNLAAAALKRGARQLAISGAANPSRDALPNRDLDTGAAVVPGGYPLTDRTYADLLAAVTKHPERPLPPGLIQAIIAYYADPGAPIVTKRNRKASALLQRRLQLLRSIPAERNAGTNEVFS